MTERTNGMNPTPSIREEFHDAANRCLYAVQARLWQLEALLHAMGNLDCLQMAVTDELAQLARLVEMGGDVAKLGDDAAAELRDFLEVLGNRVQYQPEAGDLMPVDLWASMLEIAALDEDVTNVTAGCNLIQHAD